MPRTGLLTTATTRSRVREAGGASNSRRAPLWWPGAPFHFVKDSFTIRKIEPRFCATTFSQPHIPFGGHRHLDGFVVVTGHPDTGLVAGAYPAAAGAPGGVSHSAYQVLDRQSHLRNFLFEDRGRRAGALWAHADQGA